MGEEPCARRGEEYQLLGCRSAGRRSLLTRQMVLPSGNLFAEMLKSPNCRKRIIRTRSGLRAMGRFPRARGCTRSTGPTTGWALATQFVANRRDLKNRGRGRAANGRATEYRPRRRPPSALPGVGARVAQLATLARQEGPRVRGRHLERSEPRVTLVRCKEMPLLRKFQRNAEQTSACWRRLGRLLLPFPLLRRGLLRGSLLRRGRLRGFLASKGELPASGQFGIRSETRNGHKTGPSTGRTKDGCRSCRAGRPTRHKGRISQRNCCATRSY
jgi:hypothetical protein